MRLMGAGVLRHVSEVYLFLDAVFREAFKALSIWVNWYMISVILSAVLASYCLLFLVFLMVGLVIVVLGVGGMIFRWKYEWWTIHLSLQVHNETSKISIITVFMAVLLMVYLSPLLIRSPCLTDTLPPKPHLVGHRGAPVLAPENTIMSFNKSAECNVAAFETDVQLSKDGVPFLMHDVGKKFLRRTTNIDDVFPNRTYNSSSDFTWEELQKLNAGEWFIKTNPFWSMGFLSENDKALAGRQKIPSLEQLLELAKEHNTSLMFDLKNDDDKDDCSIIINTILNSSISHNLIWWLPPKCRAHVKKQAPGFRQVFSNKSVMKLENGQYLNVKYNAMTTEEIREMSFNASINMWGVNERWLFSLLWCSGASSVTTNTCHLLKDMSRPDWYLNEIQKRYARDTERAIGLLRQYHASLTSPEEQALKTSVGKVSAIFGSQLFKALLDIQECYEVTLKLNATENGTQDMVPKEMLEQNSELERVSRVQVTSRMSPQKVERVSGLVSRSHVETPKTSFSHAFPITTHPEAHGSTMPAGTGFCDEWRTEREV
ncbi:Glycerophosphoinositol inositolphosphodiesterase GDPD2 [Bagarius yarrelli]|uniref:Glycerophosphoinositol inositolphosphodiesterase GDPD2 n=1 Tax=Bagarius yarrelli TaxID=175774 RepID=A0A556V0E4_BAGYA|nr:Glycerophosphoinositol inositolphosphodiesterase GDPD2 [Bagarius yarrelli]